MPVQERAAYEWARFLTDRITQGMESYAEQRVCFRLANEGHEAAGAQWEEQIERLWKQYLLAQLVS